MKLPRITIGTFLSAAAVVILLAALPSAVRDTFETERVYLFSRRFLDEIPQRLAGPGRLRFVLQPLIAIVLGWLAGLGDARARRSAYLWGLIFGGTDRRQQLRSGLADIRNLVAVGIVLDAVAQFLIYRLVHPGAALVVGPILIGLPYALARALTCRGAQLMQRLSAKQEGLPRPVLAHGAAARQHVTFVPRERGA
jgi:hypothetical protein